MLFNSLGNLLYRDKIINSDEIRKNINLFKNYIKDNFTPEEVVAVVLARDECMMYTIFALIECNVTFLPIDRKLPLERIKYMLENTGVKSIIVSEANQIGTYGNYEYVLQADMFQAEESVSTEEKSSAS
ncbi:MAG: AMP-binding protein [Ruminiclostridium sp.]|nr:AMP-binding protein [Ruminiclostridium sp.]